MGSDLNAVKFLNYEIALDSSASLMIRFENKKASSFEIYDTMVTIYRDENKNNIAVTTPMGSLVLITNLFSFPGGYSYASTL